MYAYRIALEREDESGFHRAANKRRINRRTVIYILITAILCFIYCAFSNQVGIVKLVLQGVAVLLFLGFSALEAYDSFTYKASVWKHPNDNQTS